MFRKYTAQCIRYLSITDYGFHEVRLDMNNHFPKKLPWLRQYILKKIMQRIKHSCYIAFLSKYFDFEIVTLFSFFSGYHETTLDASTPISQTVKALPRPNTALIGHPGQL